MSEGGPKLALLARLAEAGRWDDLIRRHESDPWAYLRRKLAETDAPLRAYKAALLAESKARLLEDLSKPLLPSGALEAHKEAFEALLAAGDFADLAFHLEPGADRRSRLDGARAVLSQARCPTAFDHEALPPERRSRLWQKKVDEMWGRLDLETLGRIVDARPRSARRRAYLARRLRRNLGEYLTVTRDHAGVREEITPFMLGRLETAIAASLRLLDRWR